MMNDKDELSVMKVSFMLYTFKFNGPVHLVLVVPFCVPCAKENLQHKRPN